MIDFYTPATYVGSPFYSPRNGFAPEALVLHIADGTLAGCDSWFNTTSAQVSAHFCVGKKGEIHQYVYLSNGAWANGAIEAGNTAKLITENNYDNPNDWTVSVEHEGIGGDQPTDAQFNASVTLASWLFKNVLLVSGATGVAADADHILRHSAISPKSRARCPGWTDDVLSRYIQAVKEQISAPPTKTYEQGFKDGRIKGIQQARAAIDALPK